MRRGWLCLGMIALIAAIGASSASAARKPGCRPAGSKTVIVGPNARIFKWHTVVWGCLFKRGVAVRLTSNDGYGQDFLRGPKPRVNGRFVAYTYYWEGAESGYGYSVRVTNLRTGKTNLEDFEAFEKGRPTKVVVNALTVTADGWLAWGWTLTYDDGRVVPQIRKLKPGDDDIGLKLKPLDSGPAVDPASLTRSGHSIQWTHADEQRSSELA